MSSDAPVLHPKNPETDHRPSGQAFSGLLRERTKLVHREAERSGFIADVIRGRATLAGYARFLRNLVPIYAALEAALEAVGDVPVVAAFADSRLRRLHSLRRDLEAIDGPGWDMREVLPETRAYEAAIVRATGGDGAALVAHAYARYMGDLSGGQILKPLLARSLGLGVGQLRFYDFPEIADVEAPKAAMRRALDDVALGSSHADVIVAEAIAAFRHNIAMSVALSRA